MYFFGLTSGPILGARLGTAQVSDLPEQDSMLRNRLGFIRDLD